MAELTALVPISDGSEEIETVAIVDTLVRAGVKVTMASVCDSLTVKCSRGVSINADAKIADVAGQQFDCIAVPGGMPGAQKIGECVPFMDMLKAHAAAGKVHGAICAAPAVALLPNGMIPDGAPVTCHPGFASKLPNRVDERVVTTGKLVTSQGPGSAHRSVMNEAHPLRPVKCCANLICASCVCCPACAAAIEFALALIKLLLGEEKANAVDGPMVNKK
jgi:4-methyl-5(b-hydroxyethyl)-thiazole monophosphate biosynthesis